MTLKALNARPYYGNTVSVGANGTTYIQNYQVPFENVKTASPEELQLIEVKAVNANGVPKYGSSFRANSAARCEGISTRVLAGQESNIPTSVIVTCTFSTLPVNNRGEEEDPLKKRPDINWDIMYEREVILNCYRINAFQNDKKIFPAIIGKLIRRAERIFKNVNLFDLGITNSNKKPFNPQPEADVPYLTATIVQNFETFDPTEAIAFTGSVNRFSFKIDGENVRPGQAMCLGRTANILYNGDQSYRQVTTKLLFKETHALILQDRGFRAFKEQSNVFGGPQGSEDVWIKNDGIESPEEDLLDGKGNILEKGKNIKPVYLHFDYLKPTDFRKLQLPAERL